jgi:hypothetical protein
MAIGFAACAIGLGCGDDAPPPAEPDLSLGFASSEENRPPRIAQVRIEPGEPAIGSRVSAVVSARDPEGAPLSLSYRWLVGGLERGDEASLSLAGVAKGSRVEVEVAASDGVHESAVSRASVEVIDRPPVIRGFVVEPPDTVTPGQPLSVETLAEDPDDDFVELEYAWFVNDERHETEGAVFDTTGLRQGDRIRAEVRAGDGTNWTRGRSTAPVVVGSGHPEITSTPPGFREDGVFRYRIEAEDPDGDRRLRYALAEGPDGMVVDPVLGELSWRPQAGQVGAFPVEVVVRDSSGLETRQSFQVTVQQQEPAAASEAPPARRRR